VNSGRQERRLFPRRPCRMKVVFEDEYKEGLFYVFSSDISLGGLFLEGDMPARPGAMLFLSFALPGKKRPVRATGEVVRSVGGGMGIRFVGLGEKAEKRIKTYLKRR